MATNRVYNTLSIYPSVDGKPTMLCGHFDDEQRQGWFAEAGDKPSGVQNIKYDNIYYIRFRSFKFVEYLMTKLKGFLIYVNQYVVK